MYCILDICLVSGQILDKMEYLNSLTKLHNLIPKDISRLFGLGLPRPARVRLNRLQTGVRRFQSFLHKWGPAF